MTNEELKARADQVDEEIQGDPSLDDLLKAVALARSVIQDNTSLSPERVERLSVAADQLEQHYALVLAYELTKMLIPFRLGADRHATVTLQRLVDAVTKDAS